MEERKYLVKENYRFNLDSMINLVHCCIYDIEDGKTEKVELLGEEMDIPRLEQLLEELYDLNSKAYYRVTGKEYGRIKQISDERNLIRYIKCINAGMSENDASLAFFE